jgi:hypothetical protein
MSSIFEVLVLCVFLCACVAQSAPFKKGHVEGNAPVHVRHMRVFRLVKPNPRTIEIH